MRDERLRMFDKAWEWFSKYIRIRDKNICYTCGKYYDLTNAGHWIHKSQTSLTYFEEMNVHCQCIRCNLRLHGNLDKYTIKLIEQYGLKKVLELDKRRYTLKKWSTNELEQIKNKYKIKYEKLLKL